MSAPAGWLPAARDLGFTPEQNGLSFHRIGMTLTTDGGWASLGHPTFGAEGDAAVRQMGAPGLWRQFAAGRAEFDFPARELLGGRIDFEDLLDWALLTADGRVPRGFSAPPESEVLAAIAPEKLLARAGRTVVRGEVLCSEDRVAIAFPRVLRIPEQLPAARRAWISLLCDDAQRRWRLVRIGPASGGAALRAEVDLTGAPPEALDALARLAAASLRTVLEWVLPALQLAADPSLRSEILDTKPMAGPTPAERTDR